MRFVLTIMFTLFVFATNQAAMAFEKCADEACASAMMDMHKQAEHEKQDPCCPAHCAVSGHHAVAMPESSVALILARGTNAPHWGATLMPESTTPEGLIEPPSLA